MERRRLNKTNFRQALAALPWKPFIAILILIMAIIASGLIYYQTQKRAVFREQVNQLDAIADLKTAQITNWMMERKGDARLISENSMLTAELLALLSQPSAGRRRESILGWMSSLQKNYHYENVLLLDRQGNVVLSASAHHNEIGFEGRRTLEQARQGRDSVISDLHKNPKVPHIHLDIITPLLANNEVAAFVLLRIDPHRYLFPLIQNWPTPSPSAETLLIRRDGESVLYLNELRHKKNTSMELRQPLRSADLPSAQAVQGRRGPFFGRDYRGIPVWAVARPIKGITWSIVAKVDRDEIERPLRNRALAVFLVVLSLVLAAAGLALFFWQRQNSRFLIGQLAAETARSESEEKFKQIFETANVGKSITLPSGEINVNKAFCDMLGYGPEELKRKKWQEITPADDIGAVQKMIEPLLQGQRDAARFNKRYIHKDGSIVWADVSVAMGRDAKGKPLHFITTVVNISERKQKEEQINNHLEELQRWHNAMLDREDRVILIKKEVNELCRRLNETPRYSSPETGPEVREITEDPVP